MLGAWPGRAPLLGRAILIQRSRVALLCRRRNRRTRSRLQRSLLMALLDNLRPIFPKRSCFGGQRSIQLSYGCVKGSFSRLAGQGQRPCEGWFGEEQGPKGKGHTFESCRVRQESVCRACRDCGGSIYPGLAINRQGFTRRMRTAMTSSSSPRRKSTLTSRGLRSRTIAPRFGMRSQFLSFPVRTARATDVPRWVSKFAHRSCSTKRSRGAA
jgi:hypothetical protein